MAEGKVTKNSVSDKDPMGDIRKSAKETTPEIMALATALNAVNEAAKKTKKDFSKVTEPKDIKSIDEFNRLAERSNNLLRARSEINEELIKERLKLQETNKQRNKELRSEIALEDKQAGTLAKLSAQNKKLSIERQKLNLGTKQGRQRLKEINAELNRNNKFIEQNSDKLTQQKIGIGRYEKALGGLRSSLGKLGIAFGGFTLIRDSFNVIKDFQQAQANLASVLGVNVDEMGALTDQAKELGATTKFTAAQVSELQLELAKLGFTQQQIQEMTSSTLQLAAAAGVELGEAAAVAGATLRGFGLEASETQRVVDVMAKSFSTSSLDMGKFSNAMSAVAPVAASAGLNIERTTALLGTLTDRGIDASTAGTGLRNIFLALTEKGMTWNEAMEQINGSADKSGAALELFGKRGATLGVILAENGDDIDALEEKLNNAGGAAEEMADKQLATLQGSLDLLRSALEGAILSMDEAGGVGEKLRAGIKFLADNLNEILSIVFKAARAFAVYKAVLFAIKIQQQAKDWIRYNKALKDNVKGIKSATAGAKAFGKALKGIGLGLAITLLVDVAARLWDVFSGAKAAREELARFERANEAAARDIEKIVGKQTEKMQERLRLLDLEIRKRRAAGEDENKLADEKAQREKEITEDLVKNLEQQRAFKKKILAEDLKEEERLREGIRKGLEVGTTFGARSAELFQEELDALLPRTARLNKEVAELSISIDEYRKELDETETKVIEVTASTKKQTKEVKKQKKAYKDLTDEILKAADAEKELAEIKEDFAIEDVQKRLENELEFVARNLVVRKEMIDSLIDEEERLRRAQIERRFLDALDEATTAEEVELAYEKRTQALINLEDEFANKKKETVAEATKIQEEGADTEVKIAEDTAEKKLEIDQNYIKLAEKIFVASSDRKIKKIEEEIAASERQAARLEELAAQGNISAQESLAAENQAIAEANAAKEQEERRKQQILAVSAFLQAYTSNLAAGDDSATAFTKAATSQAVVDQFISSLAGFHDGTEDTGDKGVIRDKHGVITGYTHANERVIKATDNKRMGDLSNEEVTRIVENHRLGNYTGGVVLGENWEQQQLVNQLMDVKQGLAEVNETIKNRPVSAYGVDRVLASYMMFHNKVTTGRDTVTYNYKIQKP